MSDIQAIRERHEKCAFTVTKTEWTEREAFNAHTDRATLLSLLTASQARAEAAEMKVEELHKALLGMLTVEVKDLGHVHTLSMRRQAAKLLPTEGAHITNTGDRLRIERARRGEY